MKYEANEINRLKRIEGQIRGVLRMMEEEHDCNDVVMQMAAVRKAIDRASAVIVSSNLVQCIKYEEVEKETSKHLERAVNLLVKSH